MHWLQRLLVLAALLGCSHQKFLSQDPCDPANYMALDEPYRSTGFKTEAPETPSCDMFLREGWYRFNSMAGGTIPTACPENLQCGTVVPIWMNGTLPTVADGTVIRQVCANLNTGRDHCCGRSARIKVRNCDAFYVYYLFPTESCHESYCAGERAPCPVGKWSPTLFPPCIDAFPVMKSHPKLWGPNIHDNRSFDFQCQVNFTDQHPDQRFEVSWLFDGQEDPTMTAEVVSDPFRVSALDGSKLKNHMNTNIECQVRSYYRGNEVHKSEYLRSNAYYAALKVNPPRLEFGATDREKSVFLTSTVPIICDFQGLECCLNFPLDLDWGCVYKLCAEHWDYEMSLATIEINVAVTQLTDLRTEDSQLLLSFKKTLPNGGKYLDIFTNVKPNDVQIAMEERETFTCSVRGDPNFTSFDGKKYSLNLQGDFTAVQVLKRNFEVQVRTWACKNGNLPPVTCICGITVREGNDLVRIDQCDHQYGGRITSPKITTPNALQEGTIVQRSADGKQIGVYLRSGAQVKFDTGPTVLSIHINLPSIDKLSATGICGTNDGNKGNEFTYPDGHVDPECDDCTPDKFMEAWRADTDQRPSLFFTIPNPLKVTTDTRYCSCQDDDIVCRGDRDWSTTACINQCIPTPPEVLLSGWSKRGLRYVDQCTNQCIQTPPEIDCGPWACNVKRGLIYEDADESDMASSFIRRQETYDSNPCLKNGLLDGLNPDPADCHNFIVCTFGSIHRVKCKPGLWFDINTKSCQPPHVANCPAMRKT